MSQCRSSILILISPSYGAVDVSRCIIYWQSLTESKQTKKATKACRGILFFYFYETQPGGRADVDIYDNWKHPLQRVSNVDVLPVYLASHLCVLNLSIYSFKWRWNSTKAVPPSVPPPEWMGWTEQRTPQQQQNSLANFLFLAFVEMYDWIGFNEFRTPSLNHLILHSILIGSLLWTGWLKKLLMYRPTRAWKRIRKQRKEKETNNEPKSET